jgi:hypothetical protein
LPAGELGVIREIMNPFKTPNSNLETTNVDDQIINWPKTILFSLVSIVMAYISAFPIAGVITKIILMFLSSSNMDTLMIVDAVVTFVILLLVFVGLSLVKRVQKAIVVLSGALFMFVFWGIESGAFFNGLNPMYPAWFEINMAINDIVAAVLALLITKRITRKLSSPAKNAGLDAA